MQIGIMYCVRYLHRVPTPPPFFFVPRDGTVSFVDNWKADGVEEEDVARGPGKGVHGRGIACR